MFHTTKRYLIMSIFIISVLFLITACETAKNTIPKPEMVGTWIGLGRVMIPNEYLNQREMPFMLVIESNGDVSGYVGDATINKTKLQKPAWWLGLVGQKNFKTAFTISGYIVNRESFRRDGGTIVVDKLENDEMYCSFKSTGTQTSSSNLALQVKDMVLRKTEQQQ